MTGRRVYRFVEAYGRRVGERFGFLDDWERDQIAWRAYLADVANGCTMRGRCLKCECVTEGMEKYYARDACDYEGCYGRWMDEVEWREFVLVDAYYIGCVKNNLLK